jgi:hypothetical protein
MCGGIVSESLVQALAVEASTSRPASCNEDDSYVLHTEKPASHRYSLKEKRIAAIHRGGGPRDATVLKWRLDGHLLNLARDLGAKVVPASQRRRLG